LNKEWLKDYAAHENEEYQRFLKDFSETGKIECPSRPRFKKLTNPVVDTTLNIWSMIPFFGSSLIHVHPCSQESLIRDFGWGSDSDINNLIQLSKDTGRVQFILDKNPEDYEPTNPKTAARVNHICTKIEGEELRSSGSKKPKPK
jgi:hypothetical protein